MMLLEESEGKGEEERRLRNYTRKRFRTSTQIIICDHFRLAFSLVYVQIYSLTDLVVRLFFLWWQPEETGPCFIDLVYTKDCTNQLVSSFEEVIRELKLDLG